MIIKDINNGKYPSCKYNKCNRDCGFMSPIYKCKLKDAIGPIAERATNLHKIKTIHNQYQSMVKKKLNNTMCANCNPTGDMCKTCPFK